jgi:hypothetical protein
MGIFIDESIRVGDRVGIRSGVSTHGGMAPVQGVSRKRSVVATDDLRLRAVTPGGPKRDEGDWVVGPARMSDRRQARSPLPGSAPAPGDRYVRVPA